MPSKSKNRHVETHLPRTVKTAGDAVRFIDAAGFCVLFPVKNVPLPSLYHAMARRIPITWDKYTAKLWEWKDELPRRRRAFYAKYFKSRGTFISLKMLPHFLATRESAAGPGAAADFYAAGRISEGARRIWEALAAEGPLATLELRRVCEMEGTAGNPRFKRAMLELQCLLIVTHFGTAQESEAWASNRFELVSRAFPKQFEQARRITPVTARTVLARKYRSMYPRATLMQVARLFGWSKTEALAALA
jgi:hypothetical protein